MTRAEFLKTSFAVAALAGARPVTAACGDEVPPPVLDRTKVKPRNRRPYAGLDWPSAYQINTTSHMHEVRGVLDVVKKRNLGFLTISNYYPSGPTAYPLREATYPHGVPATDWPVCYKGKMTAGPFDWNKIVGEWAAEVPEKALTAWPPYPFKEQGRAYDEKAIPADLLEAPNGEHHSFLLKNGKRAGSLHLCAPGSLYISGTFDAHDKKLTRAHGYCSGSGEFWGTAIDRMLEKLICPDGGGVTINHPTWTKLDRQLMLDILDWDPRVLGIEVLEAGVNSEHYWDWALSTGRQCYGLFVPDWRVKGEIFGVNVLVTPERSVRACLKAYREGSFYGAAHGLGELRFTEIAFTDPKGVRAATDKPARFEVITARGVRLVTEGTSVSWTCPADGHAQGARTEVFVRVRATALDGCGEVLYSQAGMLV